MENILRYLKENGEKVKLLGYFILILILAIPIGEMLEASWYEAQDVGGVSVAIVRLLRFVVFATILDSSHILVSAAVGGVFFGLLILMTIDPKKRWQAFLLWLGLAAGLVAAAPQISPGEQAVPFAGGLVLGIVLGGGRKLLEIYDSNQPLEFRRASMGLYLVLVGFIIIGFIELHFQYPGIEIPSDEPLNPSFISQDLALTNTEDLVVNGFVAGLFVVTVRQFVTYDADKNFFILGPRASGKSLFLIGTYLQALERARTDESNTPLAPSQDLMSMLESLDRRDTEWIVEATGRGELKYLSFQYVHGSVFPMNIQVSAMDYAGEYLTVLPDAITGAMGEDEMDNTLRRLKEGVDESDHLIFVVDIERFVNNEPLDIAEYFSILQATDTDNVLLVATKADVIAEEFKEERGLDAHLYFDEFKQFVNQRLRQSENIDSLVAETAGSDIHPVYYQTKVNEQGDRVPMRDENGSVMTVGFDELLEKLGAM